MMISSTATRILQRLAALTLTVLLPAAAPAWSQDFAATVSPPRFALQARPGQLLRAVMEISNAALNDAHFSVQSADWSFDADYNLVFADPLQADSCRPWLALEQRAIKVPASGRMRFRFEVAIPAAVVARECRFALLIEGLEAQTAQAQTVRFPVSGRLAVIVYVAVGEVAGQIEVREGRFDSTTSPPAPSLLVRNSGTAHARLSGFLEGKDAAGTAWTLVPESVPILPGDSRTVRLLAERDDGQAGTPVWPLSVRGTLEAGAQRVPFEHRYGR